MRKFFENIESIKQFTMSIDYHKDTLQCEKCLKNGQFVSHGFVYKKQQCGEKREVGKRMICSRRYGRSGCGRTFRLYLAEELPFFQYTAANLFVFLASLIANVTIQEAYEKATGSRDPRNAYRWLHKLACKLIDYRQFLKTRTEAVCLPFKSRAKRLQILLPSIHRLFSNSDHCPCANYQLLNQSSFI